MTIQSDTTQDGLQATKKNASWTLTLSSAKNVSLFALVLQQVGLVLMIRYSRSSATTSGNGASYLTSTAVVSSEFLKLILNLSLEWLLVPRKGGDETTPRYRQIYQQVFLDVQSLVQLAVPAVCYVIQNNLLFVALTHLTVPVYQVTNQGKLLTTALCSRLLLNKHISYQQYISLAVLAAGVALVQLSALDSNKASTTGGEAGRREQNQLIGLLAVAVSCFTSGFAGVYFEKLLKKSSKSLSTKSPSSQEAPQVSVYIRNMQLALWSVLLGFVPVFSKDWTTVQRHGFFQGYNWTVWCVIGCQAMTGLIVALVMKYADTILKGFATSVAVVVATVLSIFLFEAVVDGLFVVGAGLVMWAVRLYTKYPAAGSQQQQPEDQAPQTRKTTFAVTKRMKWWGNLLLGAAVLQLSFMLWSHQSIVPEALSHDKLIASIIATTTKNYHEPRSDSSKASGQATQCWQRDISNYTTDSWQKPKDTGSRQARWEHCLRFQCLNDQTLCDNTEPTNFDGPDPPCCVHILRDLAREFDRAMCYLGIEYFPAFGTLLGLERADRLIPWTIDNDYIMTKPALAALEDLWDTAKHLNHGVGFHFDQVYRLCATDNFADGKLLRWKANETKSWYADSVYPFADIFWATELNETTIMDARECYHNVSSLRPVVRRTVYNGTFYQSFPANPDAILTEYFGPSWKVPDAKKSSHGGTHCGRRRAWLAEREAKKQKRREEQQKQKQQAKKK